MQQAIPRCGRPFPHLLSPEFMLDSEHSPSIYRPSAVLRHSPRPHPHSPSSSRRDNSFLVSDFLQAASASHMNTTVANSRTKAEPGRSSHICGVGSMSIFLPQGTCLTYKQLPSEEGDEDEVAKGRFRRLFDRLLVLYVVFLFVYLSLDLLSARHLRLCYQSPGVA